jgi:hypothetical protein
MESNYAATLELRRAIFQGVQLLRMSEMRQRKLAGSMPLNKVLQSQPDSPTNSFNDDPRGVKRISNALRPSLGARITSTLTWPLKSVLLLPWTLFRLSIRRTGWVVSALITLYAIYMVYATATSVEYAELIRDAELAGPDCIELRAKGLSKMPKWCYSMMTIHARQGVLSLMDATLHEMWKQVDATVMYLHSWMRISDDVCGSMCRYNITFVCNTIINWTVLIFPALLVLIILRGSWRSVLRGFSNLDHWLDNVEGKSNTSNATIAAATVASASPSRNSMASVVPATPSSSLSSSTYGMYGNTLAVAGTMPVLNLQPPPPIGAIAPQAIQYAPRTLPATVQRTSPSRSLRGISTSSDTLQIEY